jgi:ATF/CREB family transcription factor
MFPVVGSPNTAAIFNLAGGGATPSTVDFHRTAMRAAAAEREQQAQQPMPATSQPQDLSNGAPAVKSEAKPTGPFDNHDNDAANGLFMLAQGRNGAQQQSQYPLPPQPADHGHPAPAVQHPNSNMNGNSTHNGRASRGVSEPASAQSDESEPRPNTRGKGKRNSGSGPAATNGRRKADEAPAKAPASKKAKTNNVDAPPSVNSDELMEDDSDHDDVGGDNKPKHKMTEEEKRKNFLERNR